MQSTSTALFACTPTRLLPPGVPQRVSSCVVQYSLSSRLPGSVLVSCGVARLLCTGGDSCAHMHCRCDQQSRLRSLSRQSLCSFPLLPVQGGSLSCEWLLLFLESSALILFSGRSAFSKSVRAFVWSGSDQRVFTMRVPEWQIYCLQPFSASGSLAV